MNALLINFLIHCFCFFSELIGYEDGNKYLDFFWYNTGVRQREIFQDTTIKIKCQYRSKGKKNVE